jgi:hypothetical protein
MSDPYFSARVVKRTGPDLVENDIGEKANA